jgi:hypothetical protein
LIMQIKWAKAGLIALMMQIKPGDFGGDKEE